MRLRQTLRFVVLTLIAAAVGGVLVAAFLLSHNGVAKEQERKQALLVPPRVSIQDGERVVTLAPDTQEKSGIVIAPLVSVSHQEEIGAYGTILSLQDLIDLRSNYAAAKAQVDKTQASLSASRKEYDRLKGLYTAHQNISDKALQAAEAAWRSDEASAHAAQAAVQAVVRTVRQRWGGVLAEWLSDTSPVLDRLLQQQEALIQITVPAGVHLRSAPPTAQVQAGDGALVPVTLVSPAPRTDPRLQGVSFFYRAPAQTPGLLVGMNIVVSLPVGSKTQGVVVPASAVVWWQGKAWVYVQRAPDQFVRREISTQIPIQKGWFIKHGFAAGDSVVVIGAQLLFSEEFRAQIQVGEEG